MCRNIKTLFNFEPPATDEEIYAASLQYVRKVTGFNEPSKTNEAAFYSAVEDIARISERLLASLETTAAPKDREKEAAKAKARSALRFGGGLRRSALNQPAITYGGAPSPKTRDSL